MEIMKDVTLGFCPIGKFVFSHEDALRQKMILKEKLDQLNISFVLPDGVIPDGMVRAQAHVGPVVKYFKEQNIDALFIPHCNFGTEGAAGMIARELNVPVLLYGPRDDSPGPDGTRLRDSLCGMFATSKVLYKLGVPFSYIENFSPDSHVFTGGIKKFLLAARAVKAMRRMKIAQIGVRIDFFWTTIFNESELLRNFGIQVLPVDMADFLGEVKNRLNRNRNIYEEELTSYQSWLDISALETKEGVLGGLAMRDELFNLAESEDISAFSIKSFPSVGANLGPGTGLGECLLQERYPLAVESDIHGAVSSVLLQAASDTDDPVFFPEFTVRHPENDNSVLLWHASAPVSLRHPSAVKIPVDPPWILKGNPPKSLRFRIKDGPLTVCRFDGETGEYVLGIGEGRTVDGPETKENYCWMEVDDWPKWERTLIEGPYIHHCSVVHDRCADVLSEACRYIPGLNAVRFGG
ncbi:MAG: L-fucose/L-arabinose isomerase family protein [Spirochaetia bacterium]